MESVTTTEETKSAAPPSGSGSGTGAGSSEVQQLTYGASIRLLLAYGGSARPLVVVSALLAIGAAVLELFPLWAVFRMVDALFAGEASAGMFGMIVLALAGAVVGHFGLFGAAMAISHKAAFGVIHDLRLALAGKLTRVPLGYLGRRRSGELKRLMVDDTEKLELLVGHGIPDLVSGIGVWLGVSVWLFAVDWRLAIASVVVTPIAFGTMIAAIRQGQGRAPEYQLAAARMNGSIVEYLRGMPVVKVFNRTGEAFRETSDAVRHYTAVETAWARAYVPLGGMFYSLVLANIVVILPVGLWLLQAGAVTVPTLLFFVIVGARYSQPLLKVFNHGAEAAHLSMSATVIRAVLNEPDLPDTGRAIDLASHDVELDHVSFGYGDHDVLTGVTFTARAGEVTALVGPSGAGKTTIAQLIPRIWDVEPGRGTVRIGGHDVREIGVEHLMNTVAFVFQDTYLFHDTIAANLRLGKSDATDDELRAAARAARCDEFVSALPDGYDTVVGEGGATLSGGERQRVAIARAILKAAPIIVLDEATAFADPENEAAIQDAIAALTAGKTLLVIAHRLSTITDADQIVVVDAGRVLETGRHDDLVASGGVYSRLWQDHVDAQAIVLHRSDDRPNEGDR
jgi:ATP-binding cassette subfamily B protein IrtA